MITVGNTEISDMKVGNTQVLSVSVGSTEVWQYVTYTFTINPTPSDATVTLTATGYTQVGNSITVKPGTTVSWSVSKTNYYTQTGSITVNNDTTQDVSLVYALATFTINPTPSDATVTLSATGYSQVGKSITVEKGTSVSWNVSKSGYVTQSGSQAVNADETKNITLAEDLYPDGTVVFESATPGTYNVTLAHTQNYEIWMVGGGAGAYMGGGIQGGGSGAYIHGITNITSGQYSVIVGSGGPYWANGGNTTFISQISGGGIHPGSGGSGGSYTITLSGLTGTKGNNGERNAGGASVYGGYGAGGFGRGASGGSGYFKIVARK